MELPDKTLAMRPEIDFRTWNEDMARKYSPGRYHEESHFLIRWVERQRVRTIIRLLQPRAGDMVLEVGCGSGNVLEALPQGTKPVGIDLSSTLVTESRVRLAERGGEVVTAGPHDAEHRAEASARAVSPCAPVRGTASPGTASSCRCSTG